MEIFAKWVIKIIWAVLCWAANQKLVLKIRKNSNTVLFTAWMFYCQWTIIPKNAMLCYDPMESELGPKVHGAPNLLMGSCAPRTPLLRRLWFLLSFMGQVARLCYFHFSFTLCSSLHGTVIVVWLTYRPTIIVSYNIYVCCFLLICLFVYLSVCFIGLCVCLWVVLPDLK